MLMTIFLVLMKISFLILINRTYKCYNRIDSSEGIDPAKSITGSNFKVSLVIVVMIWQCFVFLSDVAIITVEDVDCRCIIHGTAKLKQFLCWKILHLMIVGIYKRWQKVIEVCRKWNKVGKSWYKAIKIGESWQKFVKIGKSTIKVDKI